MPVIPPGLHSQCDSLYPLMNQEYALQVHQLEFGPPPRGSIYFPTEFREDEGGGQIIATYIECLEIHHLVPTFRMVVNYELGTPKTNEAVTTHDWEWISEDGILSSSYEAVEAKFDAFFDDIKSFLAAGTVVTGYRWSQWRDDFSKPDPSFRFASRSLAFTGTDGVNAPQIACAVTEETDIRRRWGRFYLPFISKSNISSGRFTSAGINVIGAAAAELLSTIEGEWQHVTVSKKDPHLLPTRFVRIDDVPDVIRSRRWHSSTARYRSSVS